MDAASLRIVVFLQGCNFDCVACHNPQTIEGLQNLDRLIQHMDGLADYLAALAEAPGSAG